MAGYPAMGRTTPPPVTPMSSAVGPGLYRDTGNQHSEEPLMTATYTFDVFSSLDGFGSYDEPGDWAVTGASKAPNCSIAASPCTARSSG